MNPGSDISDPKLKRIFYARLNEWYRKDVVPELSPREAAALEKVKPLIRVYSCR